jgi:hypothetical protein
MYKIPPRTSSAPSPIRNILASQFISGTHNRTEIQEEGGRFVPVPRNRFAGASSFLDLGFSLNQPYHPVPLYSVKGVHDVVPVEYGQEMFHCSGSVAWPALNIFPQDASSVLNGTN